MNDVTIFQKGEFYKIKDFQNEKPNYAMGIVYAIGYDNGYSKIGMSSIPADRTSVLKHYITDYMQKSVDKIMISRWHTNYKQNEIALHEAFSDCRLPNSELFSVCVEEIAEFIINDGIEFEDKSKEIMENNKRRGDALVEFGKAIMRGDFDEKGENNRNFMATYNEMLKSATYLTDEILLATAGFIDDYRIAVEHKLEYDIMELKACFWTLWEGNGLISKEDARRAPKTRRQRCR